MQTATHTETATRHPLSERAMILALLESWVTQRPGLDPRDYISGWNDTNGRSAYRSDSRRITQQRNDALAMLRYISLRESITADMLKAAIPRAFSGRLKLENVAGTYPLKLSYCTGQYWPTEYRAAACAVLAAAIWDWLRTLLDDSPQPIAGCKSPGDWLRATARRELGASIARRWFS